MIAIIASSLPECIWKTLLIWLAPTATLALSAIWIWVRMNVIEYQKNREAEAAYNVAKKTIDEALGNDKLDAQQRAEFEKKRVELDEMIIERRMSKAAKHIRGS